MKSLTEPTEAVRSLRNSSPPCNSSLLVFTILCMGVFSGSRGIAVAGTPPSSVNSMECKSMSIQFGALEDPMVKRVAEILASRIREHSNIQAKFNKRAACSVDLEIAKSIGPEGYRIEDVARGQVRILAEDDRGLLYGGGKFLRMNTYHQGSFTLGNWRGISVPEKKVRGIYFATHWFNFYHVAPIEEINRYVEDLGLWGYNTVFVWFDMHHFGGIQDPAGQAMINRLNALLRTARNAGLDTGLVLLANEAYANSPVELRADWTAGHDGYVKPPMDHYHVELCPNKPGAIPLMLKWREEMYRAFKDVGIDYVAIWPYDSGGCTCPLCKPWGVNGFLTMADPVAELTHHDFPRCKIILSGWDFDQFTLGEWDGIERKFGKDRPAWVDYILPDDNGASRYFGNPPAHRAPGGIPLLSFPEISMWGAYPWGGFGASPLPVRHQALWNAGKDSLEGGMPYSEGIYEDLNKVLFAQFFWQKDRTAASIMDEYIAYEFSPKVVPLVRKAIEILEKNYPRRPENAEKEGVSARFPMKHTLDADEAFRLMQQADKDLAPQARICWRWRILYLRALIDSELGKNDFRVSRRCEEALEELSKLYYAHKAPFSESPPTNQSIEKVRKTRNPLG